MANNNNASPEAAIGFMVLAGFVVAAMFLFYIALIICLAFTLVCFWAWNKERLVFGEPLTPAEARGFVICGIIGALVIGGFGHLITQNNHAMKQYIGYFGWGGYMAGSFGFAALCLKQQERREQEAAQREILNPAPRPTPSELRSLEDARAPARRFEFASWDDEEPRA